MYVYIDTKYINRSRYYRRITDIFHSVKRALSHRSSNFALESIPKSITDRTLFYLILQYLFIAYKNINPFLGLKYT